ncbi:Tex family protein [Texcoconibacillus texcoconensis]|uniref:S1 motif domain-containing protein n=1 Tax=Texcoconibacillus texcoconensis TaxID=1095777 RepID=A0A840QS67_9BACI|nr:Tex family protein [Texcoconibacillus texcoconensis]MBB5174204.1 uncharacterized protein [Texcoconibacillus texcoconensis]
MATVEEQTTMIKQITKQTGNSEKAVRETVKLHEDGNTVPFIARYRKEQTGGLDEVQLREILDMWTYVNQVAKRKSEVLRLIEEQGKLTEELQQNIEQATKLQDVEDLYRPYRQKRQTRATKAKEKGLEPLADWMISFPREGSLEEEANKYIDEEKKVHRVEDAVQGAKDIISERVSDDPQLRQEVRRMTYQSGSMTSNLKKDAVDDTNIYEMYYEYEEPVKSIVPHRVLALNRGEKEAVLRVSINAPTDRITELLKKRIVQEKESIVGVEIDEAIEDAYKRLIQPSIERELRKELTEKAEQQAIEIFSENLRNLLLQPPLKEQVVLGVDPAYRSGCKLAVVDETGKVLDIEVIYPTPPRNEKEAASKVVKSFIQKHRVDVIAVGNGTASRETEQFIAETIQSLEEEVFYLIVNEAGASVYSASSLGREEFPDLQVEERSAISIARRLQDPLAELVKIDPKSVGVGQYQHDVSQSWLNDSLTFVVETVVNQVGVNVNTASVSLLQYVSGLSKNVAKQIVKKRDEEGKFTSRRQLKDVPRLGAKTYEQAVGFLRIPEGEQPLDETPIHPESYSLAKQVLNEVEASVDQVGTSELQHKLSSLDERILAEKLSCGLPTLKDIISALGQPQRDPRDDIPKPLLKTDVLSMEDLSPGMELQGTVRNVVDFGAFVDIGVKQDGLVHISKLANRFVKHPMEVVSVGEIVTVWVEEVETKKGRIALTMLPPKNQT